MFVLSAWNYASLLILRSAHFAVVVHVAEDFEVVVDQPLQVLVLWTHSPGETMAGLRVVCWWVVVVAV